MFTSEMLRMFPRRRIKPIDGMAVTSEVWEEAHEYHRQLGRFHALLMHGSGVVTGLQVIASEPTDSSVYVLPGIALDPIGQTIVLPEPRAYDLGHGNGLFYLIMSYNESRPVVLGGRADEDAPRYINEQFLLEAVTELPATPHIELARVLRRGNDRPVRNAATRLNPQPNEIDLRFRREIGIQEQGRVSVGILKLNDGEETARHAEGMENVGQALRRQTGRSVWVDSYAGFDRPVDPFDLLYVVASGEFSLSGQQMNTLYGYLRGGGTIFFESCRRRNDQGAPQSDAIFRDVLDSMGIELRPVDRKHALLRTPHLFGQLPDGFETRGEPALEVGGGVVLSTFDYGCLWAGDRRGRPGTRSEIRNALEWAENLFDYALARREKAGDAQQDNQNAGSDGDENEEARDRENDNDSG